MSHHEDYATNIDEQLLSAVKNQVNGHELARVKMEQKEIGRQNQMLEQQAAQQAQLYHQHLNDDEYSIQIPDPIINSRLKIYPVSENTITHDGNLITRPFPEQMFHLRDELNEFISEFARDNGFGIVIAHSNKKAIYYTCELGGRYRHKKNKAEEEEQFAESNEYLMDANARSKKLKCPFSMTALFRKSNSIWLLRTTCNEHNHPQLDPLLNHPMLRKRLEELNHLILDLYKMGTKPSHIEAKIKHEYPDVLIKREDIYNEIRGYKRKLKRQNKIVGASPGKRRRNAALYHQVMEGDDEDDAEEVISYELERQRQEDLQRQFHAEQHHMALLSHQGHLDDQQLLHYQLQEHGLDGEHAESTAAAAIAAVATHGTSSDLLIDNIDSRLVGE